MPTTPPSAVCVERRSDVLCPVQIHSQDPAIRRRQGTECRRESVHRNDKRWIDLDENALEGYILIDDKYLGPGILQNEKDELPYPGDATEIDENDDDDDADSHSNYESSFRKVNRLRRADLDLSTTYPLANSHGNAYLDTSSHNRYSELYSRILVRNDLERVRDEGASYAIANSHGDHSVSSENRDRSCRENSEESSTWNTTQDTNYEIANSHSNYRVFYDSQSQQQGLLQGSDWPTGSWRDHLFSGPRDADQQREGDTVKTVYARSDGKAGHEQDAESQDTCDIEQCLVQIEESLLNIEQNLLHVQDLDIPELRNLLYKSPSIEKSLYEVQDILYADGIVPVITRSKSLSDSEEEDEEDEEDDEELWIERNLTIKEADEVENDAPARPLEGSNEESSDTANQDEHNQSTSEGNVANDWEEGPTVLRGGGDFEEDQEKPMNFVPNSLGKTPPRRILLDDTKENIRLCTAELESAVDYNLNTFTEKKLLCRDKCRSRTNSLDENSTLQTSEFSDRRGSGIISLQNLFFDDNCLDDLSKARSEGALQTRRERYSKNRRGSNEERSRRNRTEDVRVENSNRRSSSLNTDAQKRRTSRDTDNLPRSREKSPTRSRRNLNDKVLEKEGKVSGEKRKKKKGGKGQGPSQNALVPSKLISLSLSLLLAALLQAVRCLTDLVEDAFRSVSYDRSGLLQ